MEDPGTFAFFWQVLHKSLESPIPTLKWNNKSYSDFDFGLEPMTFHIQSILTFDQLSYYKGKTAARTKFAIGLVEPSYHVIFSILELYKYNFISYVWQKIHFPFCHNQDEADSFVSYMDIIGLVRYV